MGRRAVLIVPYGASVLLFRGPLIQALLRRGWDVVLATPDLPEEAARTLASWGVRVEHCCLSCTGMNPLADLATLWDLARFLLQLKPQAVLTFQHKPNVYGLLAAALAGVPVRGAVVEGLGFAWSSVTIVWCYFLRLTISICVCSPKTGLWVSLYCF